MFIRSLNNSQLFKDALSNLYVHNAEVGRLSLMSYVRIYEEADVS
jgi:hypothetical protein